MPKHWSTTPAQAEWPAKLHLDRPRCGAAVSADPAPAGVRWAWRGALGDRSPLEPPGASARVDDPWEVGMVLITYKGPRVTLYLTRTWEVG